MDLLNYESEGEEISEGFGGSHQKQDTVSKSKSIDVNVDVIVASEPKRKRCLLDMHLPPLVNTNVNIETAQNISHYNERGNDLTETLRANRQFGNPYILTKVVQTLSSKSIRNFIITNSHADNSLIIIHFSYCST